MKALRTLTLYSCLLITAASVASAAGIAVVGSLTREATVQPGESAEGQIILRNGSETPQSVRCYQQDYLVYGDAKRSYHEPGTLPRSNASWINLSPRQLIVPPKGTASIYYAFRPPADQELSGTYWSMLMVEPLTEESLEPPEEEEGKIKVRIRTVMRYGIQMVTHIFSVNPGYTGTTEMTFADIQLIINDSKRVLQLDMENTGEQWLRPLVWAEVFDEQGMTLGRFDGQRRRIYPGCSARFNIDLSLLPAGNYKALIVADNGDEYVFGTWHHLEIE